MRRTPLLLPLSLAVLCAVACYDEGDETCTDDTCDVDGVDADVDADPLPPLNDPGLEPGGWTQTDQAERIEEPSPTEDALDVVFPEFNAQTPTAQWYGPPGAACATRPPGQIQCGEGTQCLQIQEPNGTSICVYYKTVEHVAPNGHIYYQGIYHSSCAGPLESNNRWHTGPDKKCHTGDDPTCDQTAYPGVLNPGFDMVCGTDDDIHQ